MNNVLSAYFAVKQPVVSFSCNEPYIILGYRLQRLAKIALGYRLQRLAQIDMSKQIYFHETMRCNSYPYPKFNDGLA